MKSTDSYTSRNGLVSPGPGLPPKKFFKSKATLKEMPPVTPSPPHVTSPQRNKMMSPTHSTKSSFHSSDGLSFKAWLGKNKSPEKEKEINQVRFFSLKNSFVVGVKIYLITYHIIFFFILCIIILLSTS